MKIGDKVSPWGITKKIKHGTITHYNENGSVEVKYDDNTKETFINKDYLLRLDKKTVVIAEYNLDANVIIKKHSEEVSIDSRCLTREQVQELLDLSKDIGEQDARDDAFLTAQKLQKTLDKKMNTLFGKIK